MTSEAPVNMDTHRCDFYGPETEGGSAGAQTLLDAELDQLRATLGGRNFGSSHLPEDDTVKIQKTVPEKGHLGVAVGSGGESVNLENKRDRGGGCGSKPDESKGDDSLSLGGDGGYQRTTADQATSYAPLATSSTGGTLVQPRTPQIGSSLAAGVPSFEPQNEASIDLRGESDESDLVCSHIGKTRRGYMRGCVCSPMVLVKDVLASSPCKCVRLRCSYLLAVIIIVALGLIGTLSFHHRHHRNECDSTLRTFMGQFCNVSLPPMRLTQAAILNTQSQRFNLRLIQGLTCGTHRHWVSKEENSLYEGMALNLTTSFLQSYGLSTKNFSADLFSVVKAQSQGRNFVIDFRDSWARQVLLITQHTIGAGDFGSALTRSYEAATEARNSKGASAPQSEFYWASLEMTMYSSHPKLSHERQADKAFVDYQGSPFDLYWSIALSRHCGCKPQAERLSDATPDDVIGLIGRIVSHMHNCY